VALVGDSEEDVYYRSDSMKSVGATVSKCRQRKVLRYG